MQFYSTAVLLGFFLFSIVNCSYREIFMRKPNMTTNPSHEAHTSHMWLVKAGALALDIFHAYLARKKHGYFGPAQLQRTPNAFERKKIAYYNFLFSKELVYMKFPWGFLSRDSYSLKLGFRNQSRPWAFILIIFPVGFSFLKEVFFLSKLLTLSQTTHCVSNSQYSSFSKVAIIPKVLHILLYP